MSKTLNSSQQTVLVEDKIFMIRGKQVMLDHDLEEFYELVTNCDRFNTLKHSTIFPYVFTEQGVAMLSAVLHSPTAY